MKRKKFTKKQETPFEEKRKTNEETGNTIWREKKKNSNKETGNTIWREKTLMKRTPFEEKKILMKKQETAYEEKKINEETGTIWN